MSQPQSWPQPFGALLKRERRRARMTQEALAEATGYTAGYLSQLERGERLPPPATAELLADALALVPAARVALLAALAPPPGRARIAPPAPAAAAPLVGRARELAMLDHHLDGQGPPLLLLVGEPGIGKTRLLREAAARAAGRGWTVLEGGCTRRGGQEPYAPLLGALAHYVAARPPAMLRRELEGCAWLARLLPELAEHAVVPAPAWDLPPEQERRLMFAAAGRLLANVAGPAGALLVLDDLQWAGADALDLLASLVRSAPAPWRVVGAYRNTEIGEGDALATLRADLAREGLAEERMLGPLARAEARRLVSGLLSVAGADPARAERVVERAGGHPFFLVSCARALIEAEAGDEASDGELPWTVRQSVLQRAAALPEAAHSLLGLAAVAGREVPGAVLLAAAAPLAPDRPALLAAIEAACRAGLLAEDEQGTFRLGHDLVREALLGELGATRRAAWHLAWAEALERRPEGERPDRAAQLAWHFARAGEPARALPYALAAGDRAEAAYAHAEAERHYRAALDLARVVGDGPREAEVLEKLGVALSAQSRYDAALEALEQAHARYRAVGDMEGSGRALTHVGWALAERGTPNEGIARLQAELAGPGTYSSGAQAQLQFALAHLCLVSGRYRDAAEAATEAERRAREAGDERLELRVLVHRARAIYAVGDRAEAARLFEVAIPRAEALDDFWSLGRAYQLLAEDHRDMGRFVAAQASYERWIAACERLGSPTDLAFALYVQAHLDYFRGDWARCRSGYERALGLLRHVPASRRRAYPLLGIGCLDLYEGRVEAAREHLRQAWAIAEAGGDLQALRFVAWFEAERDLLEGRPESALERLEPLLDRPGEETEAVTYFLPMLAWACLDLGDVPRAVSLVAEGIARTRHGYLGLFLVEFRRVEGLIRLRERRWDAAARALDQSLAASRAYPWVHAEAIVLWAYGQLHAQRGEPRRARECWEQALAICRRLGERLYAEPVERALAALPRA